MYHTCIYQCICLLSEILLLAVCYRLEEGGILTDCSIQTQEPDETLDFDFSGADVLNKIIMKVRKDNISYTESFLKQLTGPFLFSRIFVSIWSMSAISLSETTLQGLSLNIALLIFKMTNKIYRENVFLHILVWMFEGGFQWTRHDKWSAANSDVTR